MTLVYLVDSGSQPWSAANLKRPKACQTKDMSPVPDTEIYLFMNVTKLYSIDNCSAYEEGDPSRFAMGLWLGTMVAWLICYLCTIKGTMSIQMISLVTVPLPFIFLIILMVKFISLNNSVDGKGIGYYLAK